MTVIIAMSSFGQIDNAHRVLNYVPDSCYSLQLFDFKRMSQEMEVRQLYADNVLQPLLNINKDLKALNYFLSSWANQDDKLGIDFTAVAAMCDYSGSAGTFIVPLNNVKRFEQMFKKISRGKISFTTVRDGTETYRVYADHFLSILCAKDVAVIQADVPLDYVAEAMIGGAPDVQPKVCPKEQVVSDFRQLRNSRFLERPSVRLWQERGMDSYVSGVNENRLGQCRQLLNSLGFTMSDFPVNENDFLAFSKYAVEKDRITSVTEFMDAAGNPKSSVGCGDLKRSSSGIDKLLPYIFEKPMCLLMLNVEGLGNTLKPYVDEKESWSAVLPLLNHPIVGSMEAEGNLMLFCTQTDQPAKVGDYLQQLVEKGNAQLKEWDALLANGQLSDNEEAEVDTVDVGKRSLIYQKQDGLDVYFLSKTMEDYDYETWEPIIGVDTFGIVVVKDDLLFWMSAPSGIQTVAHPHPVSPDKLNLDSKQVVYANVDLSVLANLLSGQFDMPPMRNFSISFKDSKLNYEMNAYSGLQHSLLYEMVKYMVDLFVLLDGE